MSLSNQKINFSRFSAFTVLSEYKVLLFYYSMHDIGLFFSVKCAYKPYSFHVHKSNFSPVHYEICCTDVNPLVADGSPTNVWYSSV